MPSAKGFGIGCLAFFVVGWLVAALATMTLPYEDSDISGAKPFADFIGREYQVVSRVSVLAWNDFPDTEKILNVTLTPPPGVRNRFVSSTTRLDLGQTVRIIGARRRRYARGLFGQELYYAVTIPGVRLPDGVPVEMRIGGDGIPPPEIYAPIGRSSDERMTPALVMRQRAGHSPCQLRWRNLVDDDLQRGFACGRSPNPTNLNPCCAAREHTDGRVRAGDLAPVLGTLPHQDSSESGYADRSEIPAFMVTLARCNRSASVGASAA